jgi:DNA-binding GntR family transcriptional regulator
MNNNKKNNKAEPGRGDRGFMIQNTCASIREDILMHRLRPGAKLTAEHIAATLKVSRTPVRQALERLCQEGYVTRIPARGYFVAEIDATEAHDLYDVRIGLEVRAMETAFERGFQLEEIDQLTEINARYQHSLDDPSVLRRSKIDQDFHITLAGLSGNAVIVRLLQDVYDRLNLRRRNDGYWFWSQGTARGPGGAAEHLDMIVALRNGDRIGAVAALREHLQNALENYRFFLSTMAEPEPPDMSAD